jgi:hypothetical protein
MHPQQCLPVRTDAYWSGRCAFKISLRLLVQKLPVWVGGTYQPESTLVPNRARRNLCQLDMVQDDIYGHYESPVYTSQCKVDRSETSLFGCTPQRCNIQSNIWGPFIGFRDIPSQLPLTARVANV